MREGGRWTTKERHLTPCDASQNIHHPSQHDNTHTRNITSQQHNNDTNYTHNTTTHTTTNTQIHCTHGFNRTGYTIVCAMMRLLAATGMCVERGVRRFAAQRPPGIYKHHYIDDLFRWLLMLRAFAFRSNSFLLPQAREGGLRAKHRNPGS